MQFKPFTFLQKMRRVWAKFLFSFFSSKLAVMLIRSTAIACNVLGICIRFCLAKYSIQMTNIDGKTCTNTLLSSRCGSSAGSSIRSTKPFSF